MDGFNNLRVIRSQDVPVNFIEDLTSLVHHWLHP